MGSLFAGGEDINFIPINCAISGTINTAANVETLAQGWAQSTLSTTFRSGIARNSMVYQGLNNANDITHFIRSTPNFSSSSFWFSARLTTAGANTGGVADAGGMPLRFVDANGVVRLTLTYVGTFATPTDVYKVNKVSAAGVVTQLGSNSTGRFGSTAAPSNTPYAPDKIDVFVNYGTSGQIKVYLNGNLGYDSGTVDTTTDGVTALAAVDLGSAVRVSSNGSFGSSFWSEIAVHTADTRNLTVFTRVSTAFGNTHNFDLGTAANAAAVSMATSDASPQASATAGQIQEFQVTPAFPTGSFSVLGVVHSARTAIGASGPTKYDFVVRTGGADFSSSDQSPTLAWSTQAYAWDVNPNTGVAWATSELVNASTLYNMGLKSVT